MKPVLVFLITFFVTYLLFAIGFWIYNFHTAATTIQTPLNTYAAKYPIPLQKRIFGTAFAGAKKCLTMKTEKTKTACQKKVSQLLGKIIREEEISIDNSSDWPHDLFFVKQDGNHFYRLGWEGKYEDISKTTSPLILSLPFDIRYVTNNCHPFAVPLLRVSDCEVYTALPIHRIQTGYLVRRLPITEEEDFPFGIMILPFATLAAVSGHMQTIPYTPFGLLALTVSLFIASLAVYVQKTKPHTR